MTTNPAPARLWFGLGMAFLLAVEIVLVVHAHPAAMVLNKAPLRTPGYEAAAVDVAAGLDSLKRGHRFQGYDPAGAAGAPFGVNPDRSTPALLVYTAGLTRFGVPQTAALNSFAWFGSVCAWLLVIAAAVALRLSRTGIFATAALALGILNFDGLLRSAAYDGPPLFALASGLSLLALAGANRLATSGQWGAWAMAMGAALLSGFVHPGAAVFHACAVAGLAAVHHRSGAMRLVTVLVLAAVAFVGAAPALVFAWRAGVNPLGTASGATPLQILTDVLGLVADRQDSGSASLRTGWRVLTLGGAAIAAVWSLRRKDKHMGLVTGVLTPTCLAYLGGLLGHLEHALPYRGLMLGLLGACVLAGIAVQEIVQSRQLYRLSRPALLGLGLLSAGLLPRLAQDVGYFVPELVPFPKDLPEEKPHIADMIGYGDIGYPRHRSFRHGEPPADYRVIANKLASVDGKARRILVESPSLAQYLRASTSAQIAGSLPYEHLGLGADLFARFPDKDPGPNELRRYLETYAIGWIVVRFNPDPGDEEYRTRLAGQRQLLDPVRMPLVQHRVYRVREPAPYLDGSKGEVELDGHTIRVTGTDPNARLTVRYHYVPQLQCRPGCTLERLDIPGDPLGLIEVPAPHPADFEITARP